jgi:hypothetical protein
MDPVPDPVMSPAPAAEIEIVKRTRAGQRINDRKPFRTDEQSSSTSRLWRAGSPLQALPGKSDVISPTMCAVGFPL